MSNYLIPQTILDQIGHKAMVMMGAHTIVYDERMVMWAIRGCSKYNKIRITLAWNDTYSLDFLKVTPLGTILAHELIEDVHADQLHELIERYTGLYLKL